MEDEQVVEVRALPEASALRARTVDPDVALVAVAREEPQAFLALYDRSFDRVLGYVRLRIRDESICEDVASTVFTTALGQLRRFPGDGTFAGWLFQIARNAVRDVRRRPAAVPLSDEATSSEPDLEERFLAHERAAHLHTLIRLLTAEQQHLLGLRYGAGLAFDEIGAIVGDAPGTVRVRMHHPDSTSATLIDPIETMRAGLTNGTAQIAGTVTINGRSLYKIELPDKVVGYFDQTDHQPVYLDNPQRNGSVVRTQVITYDELPITPENGKLLSITAQHPDARAAPGHPPAPTKQPTGPT